jgi:hypothetical protein
MPVFSCTEIVTQAMRRSRGSGGLPLRATTCGLLFSLFCLRVADAALGAFTLVNELPRPVRVTVTYNFTSHTTENGHTWSDSDIRVREASSVLVCLCGNMYHTCNTVQNPYIEARL